MWASSDFPTTLQPIRYDVTKFSAMGGHLYRGLWFCSLASVEG